MKRLMALVGLLAACGSVEEFAPAGSVRIDGSPLEDGIFVSPEEKDELCEANPDNQFCSELGTSQQAWKSAEYHGFSSTGDVPCYSSGSQSTADCRFPKYKQMKLLINDAACYNSGLPTLTIKAMVEGFVQGALDWNNAGSGVTVSKTTGSQPVDVFCTTTVGLASGGLSGVSQPMVQLPVGPHGVDQGTARQMPSGFLKFDIMDVYNHYTANCGNALVANLKEFSKFLAFHEMGHAFGFAHFTDPNTSFNPMYPLATCELVHGVPGVFGTALGNYSGSVGSVSIVDNDLETRGIDTTP